MVHLLCRRRKDVACLSSWLVDSKSMLCISVGNVLHCNRGMVGVHFHLKGLFARG
jgi:hypothetical protein